MRRASWEQHEFVARLLSDPPLCLFAADVTSNRATRNVSPQPAPNGYICRATLQDSRRARFSSELARSVGIEGTPAPTLLACLSTLLQSAENGLAESPQPQD